jgi:MYXO-CTERM domain-containing protein
MRARVFTAASLVAALVPGVAAAATIHVTPADDYTRIEAAQPGDTVLIASGTYHFRVYLDKPGTAAQPITIAAEDPAHPPVWDLAGKLVEDWPGSYGGGDNGRGCWQVVGSHYRISGVVFQNCRTADQDSAGIRTNGSTSLYVKDVLFQHNDNGFTGTGEDTTLEFCELAENGDPTASSPTHNVYVYGGTFNLRYSYVHDSTQGQNLHIRARDSVIESNWLARAKDYEADLMTSDSDMPPHQKMLFRGNLVLQSASPDNTYKVLTLYNDTGAPDVTMDLTAVWNTFVMQSGTDPRIVQIVNDSLTSASTHLSNNVIVGTTRAYEASAPGMANWTIDGSNNWMATGSDPMKLTGTIFSQKPGFAEMISYRLSGSSPCVGAADASVGGAPTTEYFENESVISRFRVRKTAHDLGAFESTTNGPSFGPYDDVSSGSGGGGGAGVGPAAGATSGSGASNGAGGEGGSGFKNGGGNGDSGGCGCRVTGDRGASSGGALVLALAALLSSRRKRRT